MARLQHRVQFAQTTMSKATKDAAAAIMDVSKFESRLLMDDIREALPRELRDMIYRMCWEAKLAQYNDCTNDRPWRAHDLTEEELAGNEDVSNSEYYEPPHTHAKAVKPFPRTHFMDPEVVGYQAAREAVENFYKVAPAYVETLDSRQLRRYFNNDNFGMGISPRNLIPSIVILLDICRERWQLIHGLDFTESSSKEALQAILGPSMKQKKIPPVTFLLKDCTPPIAMKTLKWSQALYEQLKVLGTSITVIYCHEGPWFGRRAGQIDLGTIMELPHSEWNRHFRKETQKQAPSEFDWVAKCISSYKD